MHEAALANAALPAPTVVLGMLLRPYSLGHELHLIREGNPLVPAPTGSRHNRPPTILDLREAVIICSQTWKECRGMQRDPLMRLKLALFRWRSRKAHADLEIARFLDYRRMGCLWLRPSETIEAGSPAPGRSPGAPFLLQLYQLIIRLGLSKDEDAWDFPVGLAKMHWQAYWESEGAYKIYNEHQAEFDQYCAEMDALEAAQSREDACRA